MQRRRSLTRQQIADLLLIPILVLIVIVIISTARRSSSGGFALGLIVGVVLVILAWRRLTTRR